MPGIILQTQALAIVNKGGGYPTKTIRERIHPHNPIDTATAIRHYGSSRKVKGTDYVIFECPGCQSRNKRSLYEAKGAVEGRISFKCNRCLRENEVSRPIQNSIVSGPSIVSPMMRT